jgi:hypothetical protein
MSENPFSGVARIELQGESALRFLKVLPDRAEYQIIGLKSPVVKVLDYRPIGLKAIRRVLKGGDSKDFPLQFNTPAQVTMHTYKPSKRQIELHETDEEMPAYTLWIAIGIKDYIPVFDYVLKQIEPMADDKFAFLSIYQRPQN